MKRATVALGILISLSTSTVLASEAFILNIPVRGIANQETGMVLMGSPPECRASSCRPG